MIRITRVSERQECRQDDDLKAFPIIDIEPDQMKSMSMNLGPAGSEWGRSKQYEGRKRNAPIKIVIQDLDRRRSNPPRWLFCHRDEHGWVRFSDDEAFFASPFEFMSEWRNDSIACASSCNEKEKTTHVSHLKDHRKVSVPVNLSSTMFEGL